MVKTVPGGAFSCTIVSVVSTLVLAVSSVAPSLPLPALPLAFGEGLALNLQRRGHWAGSSKDLARTPRSHRTLFHAAVRSLDVTHSWRVFLDWAGARVVRS